MGAVLGLSFVLALLGTVACAFARGRGASWIALLASGVFGVAGAALFAWSRAPWRAAFLPLSSLVALSVSPKLEASPLGGLVTAQALSLLLLLYWAHFFSALLRLLRGR